MSEFSRLRWLCRRGMKELDILVLQYLEQYYADASAEDQKAFESLLEMPDPELNDLILQRTTCPDPSIARVVDVLRGSLSG